MSQYNDIEQINGRKWCHYIKQRPGSTSIYDWFKPNEIKPSNLLVCWAHKKYPRLYSLFDSHQTFLDYQNALKEPDRNFFEVILGHFAQKSHFDLDIPIDAVPIGTDLLVEANKLLGNLIMQIVEEYRLLGISIDISKDILVFSSHTQQGIQQGIQQGTSNAKASKCSYHVIVNNYYHSDNKQAGLFYKAVITALNKKCTKLTNCIDSSVYKTVQQFRLVGSQKADSGRVKRLIKSIDIDGKEYKLNQSIAFSDTLVVANVSKCKQMVPDILDGKDAKNSKVKYDGDISNELVEQALKIVKEQGVAKGLMFDKCEGSFIILKRVNPSKCYICKRIHEHENSFLSVFPELFAEKPTGFHLVYYNCRRCDKGKIIGKLFDGKLVSLPQDTKGDLDKTDDDQFVGLTGLSTWKPANKIAATTTPMSNIESNKAHIKVTSSGSVIVNKPSPNQEAQKLAALYGRSSLKINKPKSDVNYFLNNSKF